MIANKSNEWWAKHDVIMVMAYFCLQRSDCIACLVGRCLVCSICWQWRLSINIFLWLFVICCYSCIKPVNPINRSMYLICSQSLSPLSSQSMSCFMWPCFLLYDLPTIKGCSKIDLLTHGFKSINTQFCFVITVSPISLMRDIIARRYKLTACQSLTTHWNILMRKYTAVCSCTAKCSARPTIPHAPSPQKFSKYGRT